jgi:hypothetical protein
MRLLYDDKLAPMTSELGFLECDLDTVVTHYSEWTKELGKKRERTEVVGSLAELLGLLPPLGKSDEWRVLFTPTRGDWVAYFDNGWQGSQASARIGYLHSRLQCRGIRAVCVPHTLRGRGRDARGRYGATMFEVFSPSADNILGYERVICAMNDGGPWVFETHGNPYEFEDVEQYKARRVRDRFTPEMLREYLLQFGVDAFNEDFYVATPEKPAVLFERTYPRYPDVEECTLEEARAGF